jgi:hypothetical protein
VRVWRRRCGAGCSWAASVYGICWMHIYICIKLCCVAGVVFVCCGSCAIMLVTGHLPGLVGVPSCRSISVVHVCRLKSAVGPGILPCMLASDLFMPIRWSAAFLSMVSAPEPFGRGDCRSNV